MRGALRPWSFGAVLAVAAAGWWLGPADQRRAGMPRPIATVAPSAGDAPRALDGDVSRVEDRAIWLDGARYRIAPVLAAQLHAGDRVHAELMAAADGDPSIGRIRFLYRAAPAPAPADGRLAIGEPLPAMTIPGVDGPIVLGPGQPPTVLAFLFTSCGVPTACPLLSQKLERLQAAVRGHGRIVAITLDPEVDTLPRLRAYADLHHADPATWRLGRLELSELVPLLARLAIVRVERDGQIVHGLDVLVLDGRGRLAWRSEGNTWPVETLAERLRT